jgi:nucleoid-associated protein YgaU/uncharacterized protein YukE
VSFFSDIEGIFDPGGDPAAIRGAAGACRTLASSLCDAVAALDSVADELKKSWRGIAGAEDQSAGAAFQRAWRKFSAAIVDYASGLDQTAVRLEQVAAEIQSADEQAAHLKEVALAALAVGAGLTFFTFGISDATAEASAMADVAVATGLMSSLDAMLADAAGLLGDLLSAFIQVAARFAMGAGFSLTAEMISKAAFSHENPFDPANYSANDISNVLLGGMITAGMGEVISNSTSISDFMDAHPVAGAAASGATGGLLGSAISQFAIQGNKLDASTLEAVVAGTALSAVSGGVIGKLGTMGGPVGRILGTDPAADDDSPVDLPALPGLPGTPVTGDGLDAPGPDSAAPEGNPVPPDSGSPQPADPGLVSRAFAKAGAITGISKGDVIRGGIGVPVSVIKSELFSGSHPAGPAVPPPPPAPPPAPAPHVGPPPGPDVPPGPHVPPQAPPRPAHIGGGTVTIRPGDSLYEIAGQRLGNPNLYPLIEAANPQAVGPDGLIMPGQVLHIPQLPALPPDATAQVVQPGESLWQIAGGNPALVQRIAELNHLPDPSLIQPGQVLIVPQAAL